MSITRQVVVTPAAADADGIAKAQQPAAGGEQSLVLNGDLSAMGTPGVYNVADSDSKGIRGRKIAIVFSGLDAARTITVIGVDPGGVPQSESVAGASTATVHTTKFYSVVSDIRIDDNPVGFVSVGTVDSGGALVSKVVPLNWRCNYEATEVIVNSSGTYSADIQETFEDLGRQSSEDVTWITSNAAVTGDGVLPVTTRFAHGVRALVDSYTAGASFELQIAQT